MEHIQTVIARRAIRTEADVYALFQHLRNRRETVPELHVACRIGHNTDIVRFQNIDILTRYLNTVRYDRRNIKNSRSLGQLNRCTAILFLNLLNLTHAFRKVHMNAHAVLLRFIRYDFLKCFITGIRCMGAEQKVSRSQSFAASLSSYA